MATDQLPDYRVSEVSYPIHHGAMNIRGKLWTRRSGKGRTQDRLKLLALHGFMDNASAFDLLIPVWFRLIQNRPMTVLALDFAGHGKSDHRPYSSTYEVWQNAEDIAHVIESLGWEKFAIVGHSMGGNVAVIYAAMYPEFVTSLAIIDVIGLQPFELNFSPQTLRTFFEMRSKVLLRKKNVLKTLDEAAERRTYGMDGISLEGAKVLVERGTREEYISRKVRRQRRQAVLVEDSQRDAEHTGHVEHQEFIEIKEDEPDSDSASPGDNRYETQKVYTWRHDPMLSIRVGPRGFTPEFVKSAHEQIKAPFLIVLADEGFWSDESEQDLYNKRLIHFDPKPTIVRTPGKHAVHIEEPEAVGKITADFIKNVERSSIVELRRKSKL